MGKKVVLKISVAFLVILFFFSCGPADHGLNLITAAEKQEQIEALDVDDPQGYWYYQVPGMEEVLVGQVQYHEDLLFDIYYPPGFDFKKAIPALIMVHGQAHQAVKNVIGTSHINFRSNFSFGQILAASGMAVVIYQTEDPNKGIETLLHYLNDNKKSLKVDTDRVALWGRSRHVYPAFQVSSNMDMRDAYTPKCLILYYPNFWGPYDIPIDVPSLLVKTMTGNIIEQQTNAFVSKAEKEGVKFDLLHYPALQPDFEYKDDTAETRQVIDNTIAFIQKNLGISK